MRIIQYTSQDFGRIFVDHMDVNLDFVRKVLEYVRIHHVMMKQSLEVKHQHRMFLLIDHEKNSR
jgi:hypothetical protein